MKRPSHATIVAYLALFVALGGSAFAVTQLPKNSVGAKQLKKEAVTTAKLKDGALTTPKIANGAVTTPKVAENAVTGAGVDESTLTQVPSAAVAGSATTAASASTLDGIPSSGFLQASDVIFGTADPSVKPAQPVLTVPGYFRITTVGDGIDDLRVTFENLSSSPFYFVHEKGLLYVGPAPTGVGELDFFNPDSGYQGTVVAIQENNHANHVVVDCAYVLTAPRILACSARVAPAS
jgi:hypothetical protein